MRNGHTVVELIVALSVFAVVSAAAHGLLRRGMDRYHRLQEVVAAEQSGRIALSILKLELSQLDAGDPGNGDLLDIAPSSVTYRSMISMHFVCRTVDVSHGRITVWTSPRLGTHTPDPSDDQILVMVAGDSAPEDWLSYRLRGVETGQDCPGGQRSLSLLVDAATFAGLANVSVGAPVRGFRVTRALSYRDADGVFWLGLQTRKAIGEWVATQPIAGPLARDGLDLGYADSLGGQVVDPADVGRINIRLTSSPPEGGAGAVIETDVRLRNNLRPNP